MGNGRRTRENFEREQWREEFSSVSAPLFREKSCPACGSGSRREDAKFCLVCGKSLGEEYVPLDRVRASYRLQGKIFEFQKTDKEEIVNLFEQNKNTAAQASWACLVYSLVPYLGILFIPFAVLTGCFGYLAARRRPDLGGRKLSLACVALSFVVLLIQLFLWWLLFIVPELGRRV